MTGENGIPRVAPMDLVATTSADTADVTGFLRAADLTLSGLDSPSVSLWIARDQSTGLICASTGYEVSETGLDVLIRSVAVDADRRGEGIGARLATFALERARESGAQRAWLFSRRSGPFWEKNGFSPADRSQLAVALATTHQVRLFTQTGQLQREVAWSRPL